MFLENLTFMEKLKNEMGTKPTLTSQCVSQSDKHTTILQNQATHCQILPILFLHIAEEFCINCISVLL